MKSVLSSGFDGRAAAAATARISSGVSRCPASSAAAAGASRGWEATAPSTIVPARTTPPSIWSATATPSTGKSKEPRRRSFRYAHRVPAAGGSVNSVRISSGRLARYAIPSSRNRAATGTSRSPSGPQSRAVAPRLQSTGAVSDEDTAQQRGLPGATRQMSPSFFRQKPIAFRHCWVWL